MKDRKRPKTPRPCPPLTPRGASLGLVPYRGPNPPRENLSSEALLAAATDAIEQLDAIGQLPLEEAWAQLNATSRMAQTVLIELGFAGEFKLAEQLYEVAQSVRGTLVSRQFSAIAEAS